MCALLEKTINAGGEQGGGEQKSHYETFMDKDAQTKTNK